MTVLTVVGAERPPGGIKAGVVITAEGGIEGTQVYRYDAEGNPLDGTPAKARTSNPLPRPASAATVTPTPAAPASPAPKVDQTIRTADGRTVPFALQGQGAGKGVDGAVDMNSALKRASKASGLLEQRYEAGTAPIGKEQVYNRNNLVTLDTWHGRYDTLGRKKAEIELADGLGAEVRPKDTIEVKSVARTNSTVNGAKAEIKAWEERMGVVSDERYTGVKSGWQGRLNPSPKTVEQLSMQDINRYQFRRNRSDEPGLPAVKPGSDAVKTTGGVK
ncbi:MAG: hypothetical protein NWQ74_09060 [Opitutales bacterium]|jgi:hypothetical protein|nr:hypothetical protein [Opitutales bacterium]MDP4659747.1 hypothetical protein [Opitutales bacterium]MDP4776070.1 hypothetical protein [Opitutales bacterium]MDP4786529.1 hypothetical protein [Opitutales bacterium]MDP4861335.1 hypothetical protein [Opitutales bacterium]